MRKTIISSILIIAVMLSLSSPAAKGGETEMCRIKWIARSASFVVSQDYSTLYQVAYTEVPKGHVITVDDLPDVRYDDSIIRVKNCHIEWTGAVGTKIESDTVFNLKWVANSSDEVAVTWNSYICAQTNYYSIKVNTYEKGHVLTADDLPYIVFEDTDEYSFGWGNAEGTVLTDNTFFDMTCTAKSENNVAVCCYLPQFRYSFSTPGSNLITPDNDDKVNIYGKVFVNVMPKGSVISDMPNIIPDPAVGGYKTTTDAWEYDFTGKTADTDLSSCYVQLPVVYTDVTFMLDENTVYREYTHINRAHMLTAPSCEEYAQAAELDDEYTLAAWESNPPAGPFPWQVYPSAEFSPLDVHAYYYPLVYKYGDVSCDGTVNTGDAVLLLKYCADMWYSTRIYKPVADVNKDDVINTGDAVGILKITVGM